MYPTLSPHSSIQVIDCFSDGTYTVFEYSQDETLFFIVSLTINREIKFNGTHYKVRNLMPPQMEQFRDLIGNRDIDPSKWYMDSNLK